MKLSCKIKNLSEIVNIIALLRSPQFLSDASIGCFQWLKWGEHLSGIQLQFADMPVCREGFGDMVSTSVFTMSSHMMWLQICRQCFTLQGNTGQYTRRMFHNIILYKIKHIHSRAKQVFFTLFRPYLYHRATHKTTFSKAYIQLFYLMIDIQVCQLLAYTQAQNVIFQTFIVLDHNAIKLYQYSKYDNRHQHYKLIQPAISGLQDTGQKPV